MGGFFDRHARLIVALRRAVSLSVRLLAYLRYRLLSRPPHLDIFILGGASNMSGRAKVIEWPDDVPRSDPRIWFIKDRTWRTAVEPIFNDGGVGPAMFFAFEYLRTHPNANIGLVPNAKAGSFMSDWREGSDFFNSMVRTTKRAQRHGTVKALFWFLGESAARTKAGADAIASETVTMFEAFRREVGDVPIIFAQIGSPPFDVEKYAVHHWRAVKEQQATIDLPGVKMIKTDDLPNAGTLHLTADGYRALGERFAREAHQ